MKIAVVTEHQTTITRHFGRALTYLVFTVEDGKIVSKEQRDKPGHQHGSHEHGGQPIQLHEPGDSFTPGAVDTHAQMVDPIRDCEVVIAGGMGGGAYRALEQAGLETILTDMKDAEAAVQAYVGGTLAHHPERLH